MPRRTRALFAALALLGLVAAAPASADSVLQIQFSGLDMIYDGESLFDAGSYSGGQVFTGDADPLVTMSFLVDGVNKGTLVENIYADILIPGVYGIPASGGTVFSEGYGGIPVAAVDGLPGRNGEYGFFDLLLGPPNSLATGGLLLDLDSASQITYSGHEIFVNGGGQTNGLLDQELPFGLQIGTPVEYSFSLNNLQNVTTGFGGQDRGPAGIDGDILTGFHGAGTGEVTGPTTVIPEPGTLILLGLGLMGGAAARRRRRS